MEEMKDRMKALRKTLGLKQWEVAERLGVKTSIVGAWEIGKNPIPDTRIYQLCKEYNVRREWLETGEGETFESGSSEEDRRVAVLKEIYSELPEKLREMIKRVVNES